MSCVVIALLFATANSQLSVGQAATGTGTAGRIPVWKHSTSLGDSNLYQGSTGNIGVGVVAPTAKLDVNGRVLARGSVQVSGAGNGLIFPNGTKQTSAMTAVPTILSGGLSDTCCSSGCLLGSTGRGPFLFGLGETVPLLGVSGFANHGLPMPSAGTLKNLTVVASAGTATLSVYIGETPTSIKCSIGGTVLACSDNFDQVHVNRGDVVGVALENFTVTQENSPFIRATLEKQ